MKYTTLFVLLYILIGCNSQDKEDASLNTNNPGKPTIKNTEPPTQNTEPPTQNTEPAPAPTQNTEPPPTPAPTQNTEPPPELCKSQDEFKKCIEGGKALWHLGTCFRVYNTPHILIECSPNIPRYTSEESLDEWKACALGYVNTIECTE